MLIPRIRYQFIFSEGSQPELALKRFQSFRHSNKGISGITGVREFTFR
jgi:hypothetical protein